MPLGPGSIRTNPADGGFGGDDDSEHELALTANYDPALATGKWVRFSSADADASPGGEAAGPRKR